MSTVLEHPAIEPDKPITTGPHPVRPEWIDHNGHMNVAYYVMAFDKALDEVEAMLGFGQNYRDASGHSTMALEQHIGYLQEITEGEPYLVETIVLSVDDKRFHYIQVMRHGDTGEELSILESMLIHVSLSERRSVPFPTGLKEDLKAVADTHACIERPKQIGRAIGMPVKR